MSLEKSEINKFQLDRHCNQNITRNISDIKSHSIGFFSSNVNKLSNFLITETTSFDSIIRDKSPSTKSKLKTIDYKIIG